MEEYVQNERIVGSDGKVSAYNAGDPGLSPGLGRCPEKEVVAHSSTFAWKIP